MALAAPETDGLFPSVYTTGDGWYVREADAAGWDRARWTNSDRRPPDVSPDAVHVCDAALTQWLGGKSGNR